MIEVGQKAPAFKLEDQDEKTATLAKYAGQWVVLYFYPRDDTPGCTKEACGFRDSWKQLGKRKVVVLGVSPDSPETHTKFAKKYELPFTLLSDPDRKVMTRYGAYGEKMMYGKTVQGVIRSTFVVDEKGKIAEAQYNVRATGHVAKLRRDLSV